MTEAQEPKHKVEIVQKESPILREVAKPVPLKDIGSKKVQVVIDKMREALAQEEDGVALAAPQIGESWRIFIVSRKALKERMVKLEEDSLVFINPEIVRQSKKKMLLEEGCLSVRSVYGWVKRSEKTTVRAYNLEGKEFEMGGAGLMAQIFQHEIDHLNGILFTDKAKDIKNEK